MELISRHRNLTILVAVLFAQVVGLAVQVKRPTEHGPTSLIRLWGVSLITPAENAVVHVQSWVVRVWRNYFYLRDVRRENERLQQENLRLRLEQVRIAQDAGQAQRLQALFKFKEQFISQTLAAQVIGSSGTETSSLIYIDKGTRDGIKPDMAVIAPAGIVGKIIRVFPMTSQVLEINDQSSGFGAMLEKSRLQGILKGTPSGEMMVHYIMSDEKVEAGEMVLTSGGDRIFPKGLPIGRVVQVNPGPETFLNIRVKPAAQLNRLEEVLVIMQVDERQPELVPTAPRRAADILAERLPTVPVKAPEATAAGQPTPGLKSGTGSAAGSAGPPRTIPSSAGTANVTTAKPLPAAVKQPAAATQPGAPAPATNAKPDATKPKSTMSGTSALPQASGIPKTSGGGPGNGADGVHTTSGSVESSSGTKQVESKPAQPVAETPKTQTKDTPQ
jgi:rod shape-determining protein MreC